MFYVLMYFLKVEHRLVLHSPTEPQKTMHQYSQRVATANCGPVLHVCMYVAHCTVSSLDMELSPISPGPMRDS